MNRKIGYIYIIGALMLTACVGRSVHHRKAEVKSLLLLWSIPVIDSGKVANIRDSVMIYHFDDLVMYRIAYTYTKYNKNIRKGNMNIISDDPKTIDFREIRFKNYISKLNSITGFMYDSLMTNSHLIFNLDSFQRKKVFKGSKFYDTSYDKLIQFNLSKDKSILMEKYESVTKPDDSYSDTSYYYFNCSLNGINYSFSKEADSIKNLKLSKIIFIYNSVPKSDKSEVEIPRREIILEIKKNPVVNNKNEIILLFERFRKDSYSNHSSN